MKLVVNGAACLADVPGLEAAQSSVDIVFAPDDQHLRKHLPGSDILLGWNFRGRDLRDQWGFADQLKWIHWCGAGVDAVLFPELTTSSTVLTNARGIFDRAMAEYVLGYMLIEAKGFRDTFASQREKSWNFRITHKLAGDRVAIFGVGSIGREIARVLKANGLDAVGVGRTPRDGDTDFGQVIAATDALDVVADADWVVGVMPLTADTRGYFDAAFFNTMKPTARFINVGRGQSVVEADLCAALNAGDIAGALLDVFENEPMPETSHIWDCPNLVVSPHMSGDYADSQADMVTQFLGNLDRFIAGNPLSNVVDKSLGFVGSEQA